MTEATYRKRVRGSVTFDPYWKVQYWDARALTWRDVQHRHATPAAGRAAYLPGQRCRLMEVTVRGRAPLAGSDTGA